MNGESELMEFPYLSNWYVEDEEIQKFKDATYREFVKLCKNEYGIIEMRTLLYLKISKITNGSKLIIMEIRR